MRFTAFILSILVLVLNCIPCGDAQACCEQETIVVSWVQSSTHDQPVSHTDDCSPFCQCACCAVSVILQASLQPRYYQPDYLQKDFVPVATSPIREISLPIWQPPQLS